MSSDMRVVVILLGVLGVLSCGCLCLPFGVAFSLPVFHRVREAAVKVEAQRAAKARDRQESMRARFGPPGAPRPPSLRFAPPSEAFPFGEPPADAAPADFAPLEFQLPPQPLALPPGPPSAAARQKSAAAEGGLGALDEVQRKSIYNSATFQERMQETLNKQMQTLRKRGLDISHLERMSAERAIRQAENLDRLCERHRISRAELDQIIAEGKRQNW